MNKTLKKRIITLALIAGAAVIFISMGPFYVIDEGYQTVVTRFGGISRRTRRRDCILKSHLLTKLRRIPNSSYRLTVMRSVFRQKKINLSSSIRPAAGIS